MKLGFHFVAGVLIIMLECLPRWNSHKISLDPNKPHKQPTVPCKGGKWIKFGTFRLWQRLTCSLRRQEFSTDPPPGQKGKYDKESAPKLDEGPEKGDNYNPTMGYEPYWPKGDWVFERPNRTEDDPESNCGQQCSAVYKEYGTICARNKNWKYKTFDDYCQMKNEDCGGMQRWCVQYRGECYRAIKSYAGDHKQRQYKTITEFMLEHPDITASYIGFAILPTT